MADDRTGSRRRFLTELMGWLLGILISVSASAGLGAQVVATDSVDLADPLTVYLVTAGPGGPGAMVWEHFGHNAIWIHDARTGDDSVWEWGVFDFNQVGFYGRLARGTMLYSMGWKPLDYMLEIYGRAGRDLWAQELALTPQQKAALQGRIATNYQRENREYIYNYYLDNCSTRVRDHLDAVMGGAISAATTGVATGNSYRDHTLRLLRASPSAWAGVQFVLGRPGDREMDRWEELFLPLELRDVVSELVLPGGEPLVVREFRLSDGAGFTESEAPPTWWPIAGLIAVVLAGATLFFGRGMSGGRARILGVVLLGWGVFVGLFGTLLALSWPLTDHTFWRWNENLLVASPLALAWIGLGWTLLRGRIPGTTQTAIARGLGVLALAAVLLKLLPFGQETLSTALVLGSVPMAMLLVLRDVPSRPAPTGHSE